MTTQTEPTVAKISTPGDMIASVPHFLGFHPAESIVVITLHGPRKRNGLTLRCDLPRDEESVSDLAEYVLQAVTRQDPVAVVIVCYSSQADEGDRLRHHELVATLVAGTSAHNIGYLAALLVRDGSWWHYGVGEDEQSADGTPLPDTPSGEVMALEARRVMDGRAIMPSREDLAATVEGPTTVQRAVMKQACETATVVFADEILDDGDAEATSRTLRMAHDAFQAYQDGTEPAHDVAARILVGLRIRDTRDALMTWGIGDADDLVRFFTALARLAPDEYAAPICTTLAGVAYQNHECAIATVALERSLRCDPSYYMARLLDSGFRGQVGPEAVRQMLVDTRQTLRDSGLPVTGRESP